MGGNPKIVHCDRCGSEGAKVRRVSRTYGGGDDLFVIENVPVVSCPSCAESYLTAETLHHIERLQCHRHSLSEAKRVEVADFSTREPSEVA